MAHVSSIHALLQCSSFNVLFHHPCIDRGVLWELFRRILGGYIIAHMKAQQGWA